MGWQMSQNIAMELRPEGIDFCGQVESTLILGNMVCVLGCQLLCTFPKASRKFDLFRLLLGGSQNPEGHRVVE
jgi:hypothetical protein